MTAERRELASELAGAKIFAPRAGLIGQDGEAGLRPIQHVSPRSLLLIVFLFFVLAMLLDFDSYLLQLRRH
jgi:hypothetical protein